MILLIIIWSISLVVGILGCIVNWNEKEFEEIE